MTICDEERLIRRAKDGDGAAFKTIFDEHYPTIFRYVVYRVGTEETAEDLANEVFLRLVDGIDGFTYTGRPLIAWLYTIARNLVNDHHRRRGRARWVALDEGLEAATPDPEERAALALDCGRLAQALEQITEDQRQVIVLRFLQGLDNHTVAQILDKSYGAVKALQHRGLAALRRQLDLGGG